jgi:hypothetical protein
MKNIIEYCSTYHGTHHGDLKCMFADLTYLQLDDGVSNDEDCNQDLVNEVGIINIGGLTTMDVDSCFDNVNVPKGSFSPMDQTLTQLHETMIKTTTECIAVASIKLCDHATSLLQGSWIKHSPPSFGSNQRIHALVNGILLGG